MNFVVFIGAVASLAAVAFALAPLWRKPADVAAPRIAHEVSALKTALEDVDRDLARGAITDAEAANVKRELGRRLLAADAAAAEAAAFAEAPRRVSKASAAAAALTLLFGAAGVYLLFGAPAADDRPFAARDLSAERSRLMTQAEAEAAFRAVAPAPPMDPEMADLMARLDARLEDAPDDPEGLRLAAETYEMLGRPEQAWRPRARLAAVRGEAEDPAAQFDVARLMIAAAGGYVSAEAVALLEPAAAETPAAQYFLGAAALQSNDVEGGLEALGIWTTLYDENASAPFASAVRSRILGVAAALGMTPETVLARIGGAPSSVFEGLLIADGVRLTAARSDYVGWAALIRRYRALGRLLASQEVLRTANRLVGDDPVGLRALREAASGPLLPGPRP